MGLTDAQIRALNHEKSMSVTAGAGTGKTLILVEKYIGLLKHFPDLRISEILALTFTEKAAAEMKSRFRCYLSKMEGPRWQELQDEFLWARVSTFHSFALDLLRRAPLNASLPPAFQVIEPTITNHIFDEVFESMISTPLESLDDWRESLVSLLKAFGTNSLKSTLLQLYKKRYLAEPFFQTLIESPETIMEQWDQIAEIFAREFLDGLPDSIQSRIDDLLKLSERYSEADGRGGEYLSRVKPFLESFRSSSDAIERVQALVGFASDRPSGALGSKKYFDQEDLALLRSSKKGILDSLPSKVRIHDYLPDDPVFAKEILGILSDLGTVYDFLSGKIDHKKLQQGLVDFDDLLNLLGRLVESDPEYLRASIGENVRFILVDEYQDTDTRQYKILENVLGGFKQEMNSLFIVGDPKQSIYLFRDADVTLFKKTDEMIKTRMCGNTEYLDVNFRSTLEIVTFTNAVFSSLFYSDTKQWEFGYTEAECSREDDTGSVQLILVTGEELNGKMFWFEAEAVARKIKEFCVSNTKTVYWSFRSGKRLESPRQATYGDIAILLRRRKHLPEIEWALQRHGIPYHVHGGFGFYGRSEIKAFCNILAFLDNNDDDIALYGALRSPLFGFSDAMLYRISQVSGFQLWQKLKKYAVTCEENLPQKAVETLGDWIKHCNKEPLPELLQRILRDSGIYAVYAGTGQGDRIIANIEKLMAMARNMTNSSAITLSEFTEDLLRQIEEEPLEGEAQLEEETSDSVKILTVHAAKGLEFPIVIVPDLNRQFAQVTNSILIDERGLGIRAPDPNENYRLRPGLLLRFLRYELKQKFDAEEGRLLYVALTRAKDHLVMVGQDYGEDVPEDLQSGKSWMDWLWVSMGLLQEDVKSKVKRLKHDGKSVEVAVTREEFSQTDLVEGSREDPHKLDAIETTAELPDKIGPLPDPEVMLVVSPSEITKYLENPDKFREDHEEDYLQRIGILELQDDKALRGTVIHEIFEGMNPELVRRRYESLVDSKTINEAIKMYETFRAQPMMQDIDEEYTELPFRVRFDGWILSGKIDLLVCRKNEWIIIDHKTGRPKSSEYRLQLMLYRLALEKILGTPVRAFVYFTEESRFKEVEGDEDSVLEKASQAAYEIEEIRRAAHVSKSIFSI